MAGTWDAERQALTRSGITVADGLTEAELARAESAVGVRFPPDLRSFLAEGLPQGEGFPDWRRLRSARLRDQLAWPFEGIRFDIEHNAFWWEAWGPRPRELKRALDVAREQIAAAPRLIPVFGHRYIPAEPGDAGNPIFSVYQTDIIHYGADLAMYWRCEFGELPIEEALRRPPRAIRFWSDLVAFDREESP